MVPRLPVPAVTLAEVAAAVAPTGLALVGAFHPGPDDRVPNGLLTVVLLGPADGTMWTAFRGSGEAHDGHADPLDRWSRRVVDEAAALLGAVALFPFGGPPWHPFQIWAARAEAAVGSPVGMLATPRRGLWASYRGALGFPRRLHLPALPPEDLANPCLGCPAPCVTACPVDAFAGGAYDVAACVMHVAGEGGQPCRGGCLVRASCPAGAGLMLPAEQRAFHMAAFLRANGGGAVIHRKGETCGQRTGEN